MFYHEINDSKRTPNKYCKCCVVRATCVRLCKDAHKIYNKCRPHDKVKIFCNELLIYNYIVFPNRGRLYIKGAFN